jgi:hypothetical protein
VGDKVSYQHGGQSDGKTFASTPKQVSTDFGAFADEERSQPGSDPGSKQNPAPVYNPAK